MDHTERMSTASAVPVAPGRLPVVGHVLSLWRHPQRLLGSLSTIGDVVRVDLAALPVYFVTDPELVHQVLVTRGHRFGRGRLFDLIRPLFGLGLRTADGEFHVRRRRLVQPAFHAARVAAYARLVGEGARAMADSWLPGQFVAVDAAMRELAIANVARTMFSAELDRSAAAEYVRSHPPRSSS